MKSSKQKKANIEKEIERLNKTTIKPTEAVNKFLEKAGTSKIDVGIKLAELIKKTRIKL